MRKLVSVQRVLGIDPIKDADRIEVARVLGWSVVVNKDMGLKEGDKVAYFETDSMLPADNALYAEFQKHGQKTAVVETDDGDREVTGHVLRTIRLRGQVSQGLIMTLDELGVPLDTPIGTDVTGLAGVYKYEEPLPIGSVNIIGRFNKALAPQSDAMRLQALGPDVFNELMKLDATPTIKVDGASTTLAWFDGGLHVYSRNWELSPDSPNMAAAKAAGLDKALEGLDGVAIQYELVGPGVQSNRLKLAKLRPFVFAVYDHRRKLPMEKWPAGVAEWAVPVLDKDEWRLHGDIQTMVDKVNGIRGHVTKDVLDEGIVWHLDDGQDIPADVRAALGENLNYKVISNKYLLKHGL